MSLPHLQISGVVKVLIQISRSAHIRVKIGLIGGILRRLLVIESDNGNDRLGRR